ncbi:MAG: cellulase family glycosylhydrolase [Acetatifactor sp.]|nr:cellulase family glycosylhydrolase [Acetatifactor sp.]
MKKYTIALCILCIFMMVACGKKTTEEEITDAVNDTAVTEDITEETALNDKENPDDAVSEDSAEDIVSDTDSEDTPEKEDSLPDDVSVIPADFDASAYNVDADCFTLDSLEFTKNLKAGWNLGNTLDCQSTDGLNAEVAWGMPFTTEKLIDLIKESGFTSIRIPVSWGYHTTGDNYVIDEEWMNRVNEIVDWAIDADLYVIINSHHDNDFYYPTEEHLEKSLHYLECIWWQIGDRFRDYDEHLIFEGMNEPRLSGTDLEWYFNKGDSQGVASLRCIEKQNQIFVDTVRKTGGNNTLRYLMVSAYAGNPDITMDNGFVLPTDPANHLIMSIHAYSPYDFAMGFPGYNVWNSEKVSELSFMDKANDYFVANGVGVAITEMGAINKKNTASRVLWFDDYTKKAASFGMPCFVWDNGNNGIGVETFAFISRSGYKAIYPELLEALTKNYQ